MLGHNKHKEELFHYFSMEDLISDGHILKLVNEYVDLSFVRDMVAHLYSNRGRGDGSLQI